MRSEETDESRTKQVPLDDAHTRRLIKQRFFQWALDQADGNQKRINWQKVSDVVAHHTGVRIAKETLRKNFRPASRQQNKPPNQFRDAKTWRALCAFLISDAVAYLHPSELPKGPFAFSAFAGLQAFVDPGGQSVLPRVLAGRFSNFWLEQDDGDSLITLDVLATEAPGPARVEMRVYSNDDFSEDDFQEHLTFSGGIAHQSGLWMLAILREVYSGRVRTLHLMQTHPALDRDTPVQDIALLSFEGLSLHPLERIEVTDRDETLTDATPLIRHEFAETPRIIFLTRA